MNSNIAIFGGGCFWGVEESFRALPGVIETEVGYAGGKTENPTYNDVSYKDTGHAEVVKVVYDPLKISYEELLTHFFKIHDPTEINRQGPDVGEQYRSVIFFTNPEQETSAKKKIEHLNGEGLYKKPIATVLLPAGPFYRAEEYHQQYLAKRGLSTCHI